MTIKQDLIISVQSVGIDVSMDTIDCCFCYMTSMRDTITKGTATFGNNLQGFKKLLTWVQKWEITGQPLFLVMEATGVYYESLACFFSENTVFKVIVLLPNKSKAYKQSLNIKSKTDKIDAKALAFMGLERKLEEWQAPSKAIQAIKELSRARETLLENKREFSF